MSEYWQRPCQMTCSLKILTRADSLAHCSHQYIHTLARWHTHTHTHTHACMCSWRCIDTLADAVGHLTSRGRGWPRVTGPARGRMLAPLVPCKREGRWGTTAAEGGCCCHGSGAAQLARFYDGISRHNEERENTVQEWFTGVKAGAIFTCLYSMNVCMCTRQRQETECHYIKQWRSGAVLCQALVSAL